MGVGAWLLLGNPVRGVAKATVWLLEEREALKKKPISITATAYTLKALAVAGAFYLFNDFHIRLKRHPIPGTIELQKVALISSLAGNNQQ